MSKGTNKARVAIIGCISVGLVACLLHNGGCLWALFLVIMLVEDINN